MADSMNLEDFDDSPLVPVDPGTARTLDRARKLEKKLLEKVSKKCHSLITRDVKVGDFDWIHVIDINHAPDEPTNLPPLIIIPDAGDPAASLYMTFEGLSQKLYPRRVIVMDWPGSGLSSRSRKDWHGVCGSVEDKRTQSMCDPFFEPMDQCFEDLGISEV